MNGMQTALSVSQNFHEDVWIADSGASQHMTNSIGNLYDFKKSERKVTVGNNATVNVEAIGSVKMEVTDRLGKKKILVLNDVSYVPKLMCNLLSLTKAIKTVMKLEAKVR